MKSLALAWKPTSLRKCPVLDSNTALFFDFLKRKITLAFVSLASNLVSSTPPLLIFDSLRKSNLTKHAAREFYILIFRIFSVKIFRPWIIIFLQSLTFSVVCTNQGSSVARRAGGRLEPPIGLKSMQNSTFLVILRPIFAPRMKTAPTHRDLGAGVIKDLP